MDEVEIISLHKTCNKTETKRGVKAKARTVSKVESKKCVKARANTASKVPKGRYHLFLKEQLEKMTEDQRNYCSIVSRMRKKIKEDPARLFTYNNRVRQMRNEAEKPAKVEDDLLVGSMEQQAVTEGSMMEAASQSTRSPEFVETESDDSDNNGEKEEPAVKRIHKLTKKAPKPPSSLT